MHESCECLALTLVAPPPKFVCSPISKTTYSNYLHNKKKRVSSQISVNVFLVYKKLSMIEIILRRVDYTNRISSN